MEQLFASPGLVSSAAPLVAAAAAVLLALALLRAAGQGARARAAEARAAAAETGFARAEDRRVAAETLLAETRVALARAEEAARHRARAAVEAEERLRALEELAEELRDERDDARARAVELATALERDEAAHAAQTAQLTAMRRDMDERFAALAQGALDRSHATIEERAGVRIEAQLAPLREHLARFETELRGVHEGAAKDRARLQAEIGQLTRRSEEISREAVQLTRALRGDTRRQGAWGEMVLARLLERSGLREGEEYVTQAHRVAEDGARLRPDVVVRLPGGKALVIDSKVSLTAYEAAVAAEDPVERDSHAARHLTSVRRHIDGLSAKRYQLLEPGAPDYVVMFMPVEGAFSEALRMDGELAAYALDRQVTIATPTTLMMALRTIESVWAIEKRNRNAEAIAERAGRLYDKMALFVGSMEAVGEGISRAASAHDRAMGQLSGGRGALLRQFEMLRELGAKTGRRIDVGQEDPPDDPPDEAPADGPAAADAARLDDSAAAEAGSGRDGAGERQI